MNEHVIGWITRNQHLDMISMVRARFHILRVDFYWWCCHKCIFNLYKNIDIGNKFEGKND